MIEILTVCTGNICRSPLAAQLLRRRLDPLPVRVHSAGTRGLTSARMTPESILLADRWGIPADETSAHRSRFLLEEHLSTPDLILTMTRDHRREVAELAPSRLRSTFAIREFARLAANISDNEIRSGISDAGADAAGRLRAAAMIVAARRGLVLPPPDPAADDVIDPFGRSWESYQMSAEQLEPAVDAVARVVRVALADTH